MAATRICRTRPCTRGGDFSKRQDADYLRCGHCSQSKFINFGFFFHKISQIPHFRWFLNRISRKNERFLVDYAWFIVSYKFSPTGVPRSATRIGPRPRLRLRVYLLTGISWKRWGDKDVNGKKSRKTIKMAKLLCFDQK